MERIAEQPSVAAAMESRVIAAFLRRYPALRDEVRAVLEAAAQVRQASRQAFPEPGLPLPARTPELLRREHALNTAIERLEELARGGGGAAGEVAAAVRTAARALAEMRAASHAFSPERHSADPVATRDLLRALGAHEVAWARLEDAAARARCPRLPWQIEAATHASPGAPVRALEITPYELPRTPLARQAWGERCSLSGAPFFTESHATPRVRYRSLDSWISVLSPASHDLVRRLRAAVEALAATDPSVADDLYRLAPATFEEYLPEPWHPAFLKLALLDYPSLAVSLNNMLRAYAARPFLGTRGAHGGFASIGGDRHTASLPGTEIAPGGYTWDTFDAVRGLALRLAHGLGTLDLREGAVVGIVSTRNCREFYLADFAAVFSRLVTVGLQDTLPDEPLLGIAGQARAEAIITDRATLPRLISVQATERCPDLRAIVVFGGDGGDLELPTGDDRVLPLVELLDARGSTLPSWRSPSGVGPSTPILFGDDDGWDLARTEGLEPDRDDDAFTIIYTSGSTGRPKGTIVSRRRWAEEMCLEANVWPYVGVSFLPSAIAGDRAAVWRALYNGGRVGFARRDAGLLEDIRAIRPTLLDAPPALWNAFYSEYRAAIADPTLTRAQAAAVIRRFRDSLGGRLAFIATGGAPSDPGVCRTMEEIFAIPMADGYGTTETGRIAADGRLLPGLDFRLVDVPEMGFTQQDRPFPRGELAVRTPNTTPRYHGDPESTNEGYTEDGYFLTGDIVELGPDGSCRVLARRKQIFKLAGSEFVSPELLEARYRTSELVETILITGLPTAGAVVAVVVPSRPGLTEEALLGELRAVAAREGMRPFEVPVGVIVEPKVGAGGPWTAENGLLTPSLKLNRRALEAHYAERIAALYAGAEARRTSASAVAPGAEIDAGAATRLLVAVASAILAVPAADIDPGRSFRELGADSLSAVELSLRLEQLLAGKGGPAPSWLGIPSRLVDTPIRELARAVAARSASAPTFSTTSPSPAARPETLETEESSSPVGRATGEDLAARAFNDAQPPVLPSPLPSQSSGRDVLLTGATGFLGVHLLAHLASSLPTGSRLFALARAASDEEARDRLRAALARSRQEVPPISVPAEDRRDGVVAVAGTLGAARFGLPPELHAELENAVGLIYHVGAEVSLTKGYDALRESNVGGTRRVLELATARSLKAVHFVSSLNVVLVLEQCGVRPAFEESAVPDRLPPAVAAGNLGYALSKWASERMIQQAFERSGGALRVSISRPATLSWSAATGFANEDDWLTRMLHSCLLMRAAIGDAEAGVPTWRPLTERSAHGLDLVPVDFAARAVAALGTLTRERALPPPTRAQGEGQVPVFHISNTTPGERGLVTRHHLMDLLVAADLRVGDAGPVMEYLPIADWTLRAEAEAAPIVPILESFKRMAPMRPRTQSHRFQAAVEAAGIASPAVDGSLLGVFVRRVRQGRTR